jgi:hypothetical protein
LRLLRESKMQDFERLMLAIYNGTVASGKPFVTEATMKDRLRLDPEAMKPLTFTLEQRGFLAANIPDGNSTLSEMGLAYVERYLKPSR